MRVLLVEDDSGVREGLTELIVEFGECEAAEDVAQAMAALAAKRFHLVLTDLNIGAGMGGKGVAQAAREKGARVAIMSAAPRQDIERSLEGWRPDHVLEKPFSLDDVVKLLEQERSRVKEGG